MQLGVGNRRDICMDVRHYRSSLRLLGSGERQEFCVEGKQITPGLLYLHQSERLGRYSWTIFPMSFVDYSKEKKDCRTYLESFEGKSVDAMIVCGGIRLRNGHAGHAARSSVPIGSSVLLKFEGILHRCCSHYDSIEER